MSYRWVVLGITLGLLVSCAPSAPGQPSGSTAGGPAPVAAPASSAPKHIAIGLDEDVKNLWDSLTGGGGTGVRELTNTINQHLVAITSDGSPTPRLLAELPSIERGTWRVSADGRMETTFKLRNNVFWHDGTPFTAEDLVFSWQVNRDREVPNANQETVGYIDRMEILDPSTVVAYWRESYPFADRMEHRDLIPLPKHLLERVYLESKESFLTQSYFSSEFVGLGPFRLTRWESGSHLDLAAFDRFFLGRPQLDTIRVQFIPDKNTMVANLRAKALQAMVTLGGIPDVDAMLALKRDWESTGYGTVIHDPISYRFVEPQQYHNPTPTDLRDRRVRAALYHAIKREDVANISQGELAIVAESWVHPSFGTYRTLQDAITRYSYDPARARALMAEAGWTPGPDGVLQKDGQRFVVTMRDADGEDEALVIASMWKEIGVIGTYERKSAEALRDRQDRATFSGVDIVSQPMGLASVTRRSASYNIPTAQNRWTGTNRGGYSNPAWDELDKRILVTLDDRARLDLEKELLRIFTTDLPLLPLYFRNDMVPVGGGLKGPVPNTGVAHRGFILHTWNIHEWRLG